MCDSQKIISKGGSGEIVEKKSRFIATIFPISSEEEALELITQVRKKHYDARHNCFAYVLGEKNEVERCSDDGEPSGTAGRPMLDILTGQKIHNAVVIVTRYFGGILLGTGGLVRAYSAAVKEGLKSCEIHEKIRGFHTKVDTDYNGIGKIQYLASELGLIETDSEYGEFVSVQYDIPDDKIELFENQVIEKTGGKAKIDRGDSTWIYLNT